MAIFTAQSVFKHLLTEGDRIVLTLLGNSRDRGVYGMTSSIGGIASRMLLQPVEENARLLFGKLGGEIDVPASFSSSDTGTTAASAADDDGTTSTAAISAATRRMHGTGSRRDKKIETMERTYRTLIKLVLYLGLVFASLATNYTSILLRVLAGNRWGSDAAATSALSAFCVYTALLALNGTTEAFVYGVASTAKDVGVLSTVHAVVTVVAFGFVAPVLVGRYGTVGLVGANCVAMMLRSLYSIYFASAYFCLFSSHHGDKAIVQQKQRQQSRMEVARKMGELVVKGILPKTIVLAVFVASYLITYQTRLELLAFEGVLEANGNGVHILSKTWLVAAGKHIGVGVGCLLCLVLLAYRVETGLRHDVRTLMRRKID